MELRCEPQAEHEGIHSNSDSDNHQAPVREYLPALVLNQTEDCIFR